MMDRADEIARETVRAWLRADGWEIAFDATGLVARVAAALRDFAEEKREEQFGERHPEGWFEI